MIRTLTAALLSAALMAPVAARAEGTFADFIRGGQKPLPHGSGYRSDRSPIPKQTVRFADVKEKGVIVVDTSERRLYYTLGNGKAIKYAVGVGREGFTWSGTDRISRKAEWPGWTPPKEMIARVKRQEGRTLPAYMPGGKDNPLGARALYIGGRIYRIHGTNQPWTLGQAMSSGCIRMANDDVTELYSKAGVGTKVIVRQ